MVAGMCWIAYSVDGLRGPIVSVSKTIHKVSRGELELAGEKIRKKWEMNNCYNPGRRSKWMIIQRIWKKWEMNNIAPIGLMRALKALMEN
eukprot:1436783-Amphidinium_carterae.1